MQLCIFLLALGACMNIGNGNVYIPAVLAVPGEVWMVTTTLLTLTVIPPDKKHKFYFTWSARMPVRGVPKNTREQKPGAAAAHLSWQNGHGSYTDAIFSGALTCFDKQSPDLSLPPITCAEFEPVGVVWQMSKGPGG